MRNRGELNWRRMQFALLICATASGTALGLEWGDSDPHWTGAEPADWANEANWQWYADDEAKEIDDKSAGYKSNATIWIDGASPWGYIGDAIALGEMVSLPYDIIFMNTSGPIALNASGPEAGLEVGVNMQVGLNSPASLLLNGGTHIVNGAVFVGNEGSGNGSLTLTGGASLHAPNADIAVGRNGATGTLVLDGGTLDGGWWLSTATTPDTTASVKVDGGTLRLGSNSGNGALNLSYEQNTATTFTQEGGIVDIPRSTNNDADMNQSVYQKAGASVNMANGRTSSATLDLRGGALELDGSIIGGLGTPHYRFDGGTIRATGEGSRSYTFANANIAAGGLTLDTGTNTVLIADAAGISASAEKGTLTKAGSGILSLDALPSCGNIAVAEGTAKLVAAPRPTLAHRWSFNGNMTDSVTGAEPAETKGVENAEYVNDGKVLRLSGGVDSRGGNVCGVNFGAGMWPSDSMTLEIWTTLRQKAAWQKMFCFSGMQFTYNAERADGPSCLSLLGQNGTANIYATGSLDLDTPYCFTITLTSDGAGGTRIRAARWDAATGDLLGTSDRVCPGWHVLGVNQENFWIGRSYWEGDASAYADFDEIRIWDGVFTDAELRRHVKLGPDTLSDRTELFHRWSFNGSAKDSVGGGEATFVGGVTYADDGTNAKLAGGDRGSSYIDLGDGVLPLDDTPFTIEMWTTLDRLTPWVRMFSFGKRKDGVDDGNWMHRGIYLPFKDGGDWWKILFRNNSDDANLEYEIQGESSFEQGGEYHVAVTVTPFGNGNSEVSVYAYNAATGAKLRRETRVLVGWTPSDLREGGSQPMQYWLGHSQWGDGDASARYNEVRIWKGALTEAQIAGNTRLGPDQLPAMGRMRHRWSFNGSTADSVGGSEATFMGSSAIAYSANATRASLPGGSRGAAWIDLGDDVIPTNNTPFTIEMWTSLDEYSDWVRMFSFGRRNSGSDGMQNGLFCVSRCGSDQGNEMRISTRNDNVEDGLWSNPFTLEGGREYHVAFTVVPDGSGNTEIRMFVFDPSTGEKIVERWHDFENWLPSTIANGSGELSYWLGHSQWGDNDAHARYNEVRIWNEALTEAQLRYNNALGPDNLDVGASVEVSSGATLDLGGFAPALGGIKGAGTVVNGEDMVLGEVSPGGDGVSGTLTLNGDVVVTGTIRLDEGDKIVVNGSLDLSQATVEIIADDISSSFVFASATGGITGTPAVSETGRWNRRCSIKNEGNEIRVLRRGFIFMVF